jgi:hypothetical protein
MVIHLPVNAAMSMCRAVSGDIEVDSVMEHALALKPFADATLDQKVNYGVLQDAGANALDYIIL